MLCSIVHLPRFLPLSLCKSLHDLTSQSAYEFGPHQLDMTASHSRPQSRQPRLLLLQHQPLHPRLLLHLPPRLLNPLNLLPLRIPTIRLPRTTPHRQQRRPFRDSRPRPNPARLLPPALPSLLLRPSSQYLKKPLIRLIEKLLLITPSQDLAFGFLRFFLVVRTPGVKTQLVPDCLRLFVGFGDVVEFDLDLEFAPAGFGDFEGLARGCFDVCELLALPRSMLHSSLGQGARTS